MAVVRTLAREAVVLQWQGWEWALWGAAVGVAVAALVRLMLRKRDEVWRALLSEAERERREKLAAEKASNAGRRK